MTAAWLLPIVATIVAAASGGIVAEVLPNPQHALWTVIVSYILWSTGVPLAMVVLVIYFQRLTVHKLPPKEVIVSVFLPLGPLGQGGFAIMQLGKVSLQIFPKTHTLKMAGGNPGAIFYVMGYMIALIMWGFGIVWLFFALASISRSKFPFNMGWWGFTFPLGVFTVSTTTLGKELPSAFFDVLGTVRILSCISLELMGVSVTIDLIITIIDTQVCLDIFCIGVFAMDRGRLWDCTQIRQRKFLFAPCLKDLEGSQQAQVKKHFGERAA